MTIAVIAVLALLRFKPWQREPAAPTGGTATGATPVAARETLTVGFLPVT
jgi:hypothetical protein